MPSMMNCTASAASTTPESRLVTLAPVTPSTPHEAGCERASAPSTPAAPETTTPRKPDEFSSGLPRTSPAVRRMVASAPGPAMKGNARGNTEMSSRDSWPLPVSGAGRAWSPTCGRRPFRAQIRNSRVPPAMRNELKADAHDFQKASRPPSANKHADDEGDQPTALQAIFFL